MKGPTGFKDLVEQVTKSNNRKTKRRSAEGKTRADVSESECALQREKLMELRPWDRVASIRGLRGLVRVIFKDRNAAGAAEREHDQIKAEMRPWLRESLRCAGEAMEAIRAGDREKYRSARDRARMYRAFAILELFQPYANKMGARIAQWDDYTERASDQIIKNAWGSKQHRDQAKELIKAAHERREKPDYANLAAQYGVDARTIRRLEKEVDADEMQSIED